MNSSRLTPRTAAFAIIGLAMVASAILIAYWGRGLTFGGDQMGYASRLSAESLGHALLYPPHDKYLIAVPLLFFRGFFEVFGFDSETPFRALAIALQLLCAGLFFLLARRRVGDLLALPPTVLLLFFGYGGEMVLTGERIPELIAFSAGLGTLLVLPWEDRRGDVAAAVLLAISLASHPAGLAFAAAAAVLIALRPPPQRWRSAWVFIVPVALYGVWWVFLREPGIYPVQENLGKLAAFAGESWTAVTAAVSGLAGVLDGPPYDHLLGWVAGALLFILVAAGVATRWRRLPPSFWAAATALLALWLLTGLTRGSAGVEFVRPADSPRYLYPGAVLLLLVLVELAGAVRRPAWGVWAATGVLALGLVANLDRLRDEGTEQRLVANHIRAGFGSVEIAAGVVEPAYRPFGLLGAFYPNAGEYLNAVRAFGSPAYSPERLATLSAGTKLLADRTLAEAMRMRVRSTPSKPSVGSAPRVERALQGTSSTAGGCLELRAARGTDAFSPQPAVPPPPELEGSAKPPALAEVTLPPGGVSIEAEGIANVGLRLGRFTDPPALPLETPAAGRYASLAIPGDDVTLPWKLIVYSREPVSLCGLAPAPA